MKRPNVKTLTKAKGFYKLHCRECNWTQHILSQTGDPPRCCAWCGWSDLKISQASQKGAFQEINCEVHGNVVVSIPSDEIEPLDFMDNLFCPFCE